MTTAEIDIVVPDVGGTTDLDVIEILVKPGDPVKVDTPLVTLESDKATMDVPSTEEGIVRALKVKVGDKIAEGAPLLTLEKPAGTHETASEKTGEAPVKSSASSLQKPVRQVSTMPEIQKPAAEKIAQPAVSPAADDIADRTDGGVHAGPAVRKLARELGVNLLQVPATGPKERILKEDIEGYVKSRLAQAPSGTGLPAAPVVDFSKFGPVAIQPLSRIKKSSGKNLHRNWVLVPHVTQFGEADITDLETFRQAEKKELEKIGIRLTLPCFVMKAVIAGLKKFPQFNASLDAAGENLVMKKYFHLGVAVDTPDGLVVPVIRNVDQKNLSEIAQELSVISEKTRNKQLLPAETQGGCFSISSLGGIGGTAFTPIVNLPEVAILGISRASFKPCFQNNVFVPRLMLPLSLSYDHRVIDGADAARFVEYVTDKLSDIRKLLF